MFHKRKEKKLFLKENSDEMWLRVRKHGTQQLFLKAICNAFLYINLIVMLDNEEKEHVYI